MTRIAVSYDKFATSQSGGGRESLLTLLNEAAKELNFTVDAFQTPPIDDPPDMPFKYHVYSKNLIEAKKLTWMNQVLRRRQWKRYLRKELTKDYDLLITQNDLAPASVGVENSYDIPSIYLTSSLALTGYEKYDQSCGHLSNLYRSDFGGLIQYPFLWKNFHDYKQAAQHASRTRASSNFASDKLAELFGASSTVIYPPIDIDQYRVSYDETGYITMVNPRAAYKGADIFLDIAKEKSDEQFLLVGSISSSQIRETAEAMTNVTHWEWRDDIRDAYSASKLIIAPSRVEETFGRVPAEAMVSGIPCVVSNRGGLPEVVGNTGEIVYEIESLDNWINAIDRAFKNHDSEAQKKKVERFSSVNQGKNFTEMVKSLL